MILAVVYFLYAGLLPNGYGSDVEVARAQAINILRLSVFSGIIAAGRTLVIISGSEGIDLSAGSVVTLTAIFTYVIVKGEDDKVLLALLVSLAVGALIGLLNGAGITYLKISPFVIDARYVWRGHRRDHHRRSRQCQRKNCAPYWFRFDRATFFARVYLFQMLSSSYHSFSAS